MFLVKPPLFYLSISSSSSSISSCICLYSDISWERKYRVFKKIVLYTLYKIEQDFLDTQ